MKRLVLAGLLLASASATAATVNVVSLKLNDFDFVMTVQPIAGHSGDTSTAELVDATADLIAGAVDPALSFALANVSFGVAGSEAWSVAARTTAATTATIDTATNQITIDLGGWLTAWTQTGVVPPRTFRGCGGSFPECADVDQSPVGGSVTGSWDPLTNAFEVAWTRDIARHPFPVGIGNWTLRGSAVVPVPGALGLMFTALAGLGAVRLRQRATG
jgi:hypothetical protein